MKATRSIPLLLSVLLVLFLLGGGLAVQVGADDNSFHQVVVFSEVLSLVLDNYVDPLEARSLLHGAYEGMLGGLDPHGAYLTPEELVEWKAYDGRDLADPGISVLQAGRALQVISVTPESPADEAGILVGDQIRRVDERPVRELSLDQARRLILGQPGSTVRLDLLHSSSGFRREEIEVKRALPKSPPYEIDVRRGIAVLDVRDMTRIRPEELIGRFDKLRKEGVDRLLVDLRNVADTHPGEVAPTASVFASGPLLRLRDRSGAELEAVDGLLKDVAWKGSVVALVNGATAGSSEGLASVIRSVAGGSIVGEQTYGLGSEARLFEMEDGSGLLVSAALWETAAGTSWNGDGVEIDEVIRGRGTDYEDRFADQLERALDFVEGQSTRKAA